MCQMRVGRQWDDHGRTVSGKRRSPCIYTHRHTHTGTNRCRTRVPHPPFYHDPLYLSFLPSFLPSSHPPSLPPSSASRSRSIDHHHHSPIAAESDVVVDERGDGSACEFCGCLQLPGAGMLCILQRIATNLPTSSVD